MGIAMEDELMNVKQEYSHEVDAKKSLEYDCQNLYKKWNDELKIQAQEFEKIQSEMIPNTELELLRVKMLEELELAYNDKLDWMKQEMANYQNLYTKTLRELEISKISHVNCQNQFQQMLAEQKDTLNFKILHLKQQNEDLQKQNAKNESHSLKQQLQQLKGANLENNTQIKTLRTEINELHKQNSALTIENEQIKCKHIEQLKACEGKLLIANAECNGLNQRYDDLRSEFDTTNADNMTKENELQKMESSQLFIKHQLEGKKEELMNLQDSFGKKGKMNKEQHNQEIKSKNEQIKSMQDDIHRIKAMNDELKGKMNKMINEHLIETQQIKQDNFTNFNNLIESKQETEKRLQEIKGQLMQFQHDSDREMHSLSKA